MFDIYAYEWRAHLPFHAAFIEDRELLGCHKTFILRR